MSSLLRNSPLETVFCPFPITNRSRSGNGSEMMLCSLDAQSSERQGCWVYQFQDAWNHQIQRKTKGGGTQGRGKHTIKPLPKNGFGPPPLMIRFPPPLFTPCHFLRGNGHRPDESHFLRPPNPQNRTIRFPPPLANSQQIVDSANGFETLTL